MDTVGLKKIILDLIKEGGLTPDEMAERIYQNRNISPSWEIGVVRQIIYRLRKSGHLISNKPDCLWTGKTGKGHKARYYYYGHEIANQA
jgi:hypothetical protein